MLGLLPARRCIAALALAASFLGLSGCERQPATPSAAVPVPSTAAPSGSSATDPYDTSKMDFNSGPATLSSERHKGPFAAGDSLSMDETVKPLSPSQVKEIRLDTTHKSSRLRPA
jgi:hypothetical protein